MSVVMIALAVPDAAQEEALQAYSAGALPLIKSAGGKPIGRFKYREGLVGDDLPQTVLAVEFPSADAIRTFVEGADYRSLIPHRDKAFTRFELFICDSA